MPWAFLIYPAKHEFLTLVIGNTVVTPDRIKPVLHIEGMKHLAEEMAVAGYFSENYKASKEDLPEMEPRVLDDGRGVSSLRCRSC